MEENEKVYVVEILDDVDRLLTEEDIEDVVRLRDLLRESADEEIEKAIIGYSIHDAEATSEAYTRIRRVSMSAAESVYGVLPMSATESVYDDDGDSPTTINALFTDDTEEEIEEQVLYGGKDVMYRSDEPIDESLSRIYRGAMSTTEAFNSISSAMENMSKYCQSDAEWAKDMYGALPMTGDSSTTTYLLFTDKTEEPVRPKKRGERCNFCSNMTKKELKKHDSCPSCGRSLFALKSRGW